MEQALARSAVNGQAWAWAADAARSRSPQGRAVAWRPVPWPDLAPEAGALDGAGWRSAAGPLEDRLTEARAAVEGQTGAATVGEAAPAMAAASASGAGGAGPDAAALDTAGMEADGEAAAAGAAGAAPAAASAVAAGLAAEAIGAAAEGASSSLHTTPVGVGMSSSLHNTTGGVAGVAAAAGGSSRCLFAPWIPSLPSCAPPPWPDPPACCTGACCERRHCACACRGCAWYCGRGVSILPTLMLSLLSALRGRAPCQRGTW